jgi:glycosyltransferase involved in cell wall biosynthesis
LIVSALVPYKRLDLAIDTFNKNGKTLVIVGTGPEFKHLKKMSAPNIQFLGRVEAAELREFYRKAAAMLQPGEEDFGINIIEALSSRCPVIGYARGGVLESIVDGETGILFNELTPAAVQQAIDKASSIRFNNALMRETALRFSPARFKSEFQRLIPQKATVNDGFAKK